MLLLPRLLSRLLLMQPLLAIILIWLLLTTMFRLPRLLMPILMMLWRLLKPRLLLMLNSSLLLLVALLPSRPLHLFMRSQNLLRWLWPQLLTPHTIMPTPIPTVPTHMSTLGPLSTVPSLTPATLWLTHTLTLFLTMALCPPWSSQLRNRY